MATWRMATWQMAAWQKAGGKRLAWAAAGLLLAGPAAADTVKIGMILSLSGPGADIGQNIQKGADLYAKLHKRELPPGIDVQFIVRDDGSNAANTKRLAQELVVRDHVHMLAGITLSPSGFTVASVATEAKIPTVVMNATTGSVTRSSPYIVRFSHSNWQMGYTLGIWAAKHGIANAYVLAADYAAGVDNEAAFTGGFTSAGGTIVGSDHAPLTTTDYLPYMDRIKAAKPQSLFMFTIAGPATIATMKAVGDADLRGAHIQLMGTGDQVPDDELPAIGPAAAGFVDASIYTVTNDRPQNVAFLKAWKQEYGETSVPDFAALAAWSGTTAIFETVKQLGMKATGDAAMAVLSHFKDPDAPQGPIEIDPETRDIVQNVYLCRIEKVGDSYENVVFETQTAVKDPWKILNPEK